MSDVCKNVMRTLHGVFGGHGLETGVSVPLPQPLAVTLSPSADTPMAAASTPRNLVASAPFRLSARAPFGSGVRTWRHSPRGVGQVVVLAVDPEDLNFMRAPRVLAVSRMLVATIW